MKLVGIERQVMTSGLWAAILPWRNDPTVYSWTKTDRVIDLKEHLDWFKDREPKLASEPIFAYFRESTYLGMARLDKLNTNCFEVSIIVNPEYRGCGYGARILEDICQFPLTNKLSEFKLLAVVHSANLASLALFYSSGFTKVSEQHPFVFLEFKYI